MASINEIRDVKFVPADIKQELTAKKFPTVMMWNRVEASPRTHDFDKALKAEVRDALWMLTKQWQMGEFKGDDAGTPVAAKIHIATSQLSTYRAAANNQQSFEKNVPLETKAEQKKIPFVRNGKDISIDIRLQMGRYWLQLSGVTGSVAKAYIARYPFALPANDRNTDYIYAHKNVWQQYAAISGRSLDGYKLYEYLAGGGKASDGITVSAIVATGLDDFGDSFVEWYRKMYYQPLEEKNNAWLTEKLEYQFECSAAAGREEKNISAEEYYHGHLDWYAFDIKQKRAPDAKEPKTPVTSSFIPAHVEFEGMPNTRWWKFEDKKTSFGNIKPSTIELAQLLLMEFGLVYANDWFVVPFSLPIGSLANIEGLAVKNNFGETTWIQPAEDAGVDDTTWSMFKLSSADQNNTLLLAPTAIAVDQGDPLEEILMIRDEMSNMVWGIETVVPTPLGKGDRGGEAGLRTRQFHEKVVLLQWLKQQSAFFTALIAAMPNLAVGAIDAKSDVEKNIFALIKDLPARDAIIAELSARLALLKNRFDELTADLNKPNPDLDFFQRQLAVETTNFYDSIKNALTTAFEKILDKTALDVTVRFLEMEHKNNFAAAVSYLAMTSVPENWIPFVPVHKKDSNRDVMLQRASMQRIIDHDVLPPAKIKPHTSLLREGLEAQPKPLSYHLLEQEVLRAGIKVSQAFQRTRWTSGEVYVWLGVQKTTGRGEGSSGLAFDHLKDVGLK